MTAAERAEWNRHVAERGRGRPKIGAGAVRIPISLEGGLAERLDAFAQKTGAKRSQVIARALEMLLAVEGNSGKAVDELREQLGRLVRGMAADRKGEVAGRVGFQDKGFASDRKNRRPAAG